MMVANPFLLQFSFDNPHLASYILQGLILQMGGNKLSDIPLSALSDDISSNDIENCSSVSPHLQLFPFPSSTGERIR